MPNLGHFINYMPILCECHAISANTIPILSQSWVNHPVMSAPDQPVTNPSNHCQFPTNPPIFHLCMTNQPVRDQPTKPINHASPIIHSNHPHWHSIGNGPANNRPIRVTNPHLVKGTSTIRCQLLSGPHHSRATVNQVPIQHQYDAIHVSIHCHSCSS